MGAVFNLASSMRLRNSAAPVLAVPFTVGMWFNPSQLSSWATLWSLCDTGTSNNYFYLAHTPTAVNIGSAAGGTNINASVGTVVQDRWHYIIGRFISATNRRIDFLQADGAFFSGQQTTSRVPTGIDTMALASREINVPLEFFSGAIAEFFVANIDIQADGAILNERLLRQLAYGGPFSVQHIAKNIVDYRALRSSLGSDQDVADEWDFGGTGKQGWSSVNGVTLGTHPPLPYWYERPTDNCRNLIV